MIRRDHQSLDWSVDKCPEDAEAGVQSRGAGECPGHSAARFPGRLTVDWSTKLFLEMFRDKSASESVMETENLSELERKILLHLKLFVHFIY